MASQTSHLIAICLRIVYRRAFRASSCGPVRGGCLLLTSTLFAHLLLAAPSARRILISDVAVPSVTQSFGIRIDAARKEWEHFQVRPLASRSPASSFSKLFFQESEERNSCNY